MSYTYIGLRNLNAEDSLREHKHLIQKLKLEFCFSKDTHKRLWKPIQRVLWVTMLMCTPSDLNYALFGCLKRLRYNLLIRSPTPMLMYYIQVWCIKASSRIYSIWATPMYVCIRAAQTSITVHSQIQIQFTGQYLVFPESVALRELGSQRPQFFLWFLYVMEWSSKYLCALATAEIKIILVRSHVAVVCMESEQTNPEVEHLNTSQLSPVVYLGSFLNIHLVKVVSLRGHNFTKYSKHMTWGQCAAPLEQFGLRVFHKCITMGRASNTFFHLPNLFFSLLTCWVVGHKSHSQWIAA